MNKILIVLVFLYGGLAIAQTDKVVRNRGLDQDLIFCVNDGGADECPASVDGAEGVMTYKAIGMKVRKTSASAVFNSGAAFINTYSVVDYNLGGGSITNSNGRYTPAVAGIYRLSVNVWFSCSRALLPADNNQVYFLKNGTAFTRKETKGDLGSRFTIDHSTTVVMNGSTDYLEVQLLTEDGGAGAYTCTDFSDGGQPFSSFSVEYIGRE